LEMSRRGGHLWIFCEQPLLAEQCWVYCVKKTRKRRAVRTMKEGPSEPLCRKGLQTAISCFGQKPRW
jgi:hypothetical protein